MALETERGEPALQDRYGSTHVCFGCGPSNPKGLRIKSYPADDGETTVAEWMPAKHHEAFEGVLAGGIIGTLLDCHSNWTAAWHLMKRTGAGKPPCTVTAKYAVELVSPCPTDGPVRLAARVVDSSDRRATVEATLEAKGEVRARCAGTFVAVKEGHPAHDRW